MNLRYELFVAKYRLRYGYYLKNTLERYNNRKKLKELRKRTVRNKKDPLVSILIATYNRPKCLTQRAIKSVLNQTYENFEIVVVGDHCTEETVKAVSEIDDERLIFHNLPERGKYPEDPVLRWMVAGVTPSNKAIDMASGEWLGPLDDDDAFSPDHIEVLLNHALENDYEMVYGKVLNEEENGHWSTLGSYPLQEKEISRMAVLYHSNLSFMKYDINSWKYYQPGDWNLWRRMKEAGVKIGFVDEVVGNHYQEMSQLGV